MLLQQRAQPAQAASPEAARAGQVLLVDAGFQERLEGVGLRGHVRRLWLVEHERQEGGLEVGQLQGPNRDPIDPSLAGGPDPRAPAQDLVLVLLTLASGRDQRTLGQAEVLDDANQGRAGRRRGDVVWQVVLLCLEVAGRWWIAGEETEFEAFEVDCGVCVRRHATRLSRMRVRARLAPRGPAA